MTYANRTGPRRTAPLFLACLWFLPTTAHAAEPVEQWGLLEIELSGPSDGNPFLEVDVSAAFTQDTS